MKKAQWSVVSLLLALGVGMLVLQQLDGSVSLATESPAPTEFVWKQSLPLRPGDPQIMPIGGTEVRALVTFDKKLFAAIGYWMDTETKNPALPGAQVLRLDSADSQWQVDFQLDDRNQNGLRSYQAISTLDKVRFTVDSAGRPLETPAEFLLASVWKRGFGLDVFSRASGPGKVPWTKITIPADESTPARSQIRAFALHKDRVTGKEFVFAGATDAIRVGGYNRERQNIVWSSSPEWQWQGDLSREHPDRARIASFAECNGKLYGTARGAIFEREDGPFPAWKAVFETTIYSPARHITGLRGLTCIRDPSRSINFLLVSVEDNPSRIYRVDPAQTGANGQYASQEELDVSAFLSKSFGTRVTYAIVAYNNMTEYRDSRAPCSRLLMGLEAITPQGVQTFGAGHFNPNGDYLLRDCEGKYTLHRIRDLQIEPEPQLVSVRAFAASPFPADPPGTVYAGGFDANYNPVHNTAWLYKGVPAAQR